MSKTLGTVIILVGLVLTLVGAAVAAHGVIITRKQAEEIASTKWDMNKQLRDGLLDQSNKAKWGLILVAVGTGFQIVGTILTKFNK